MVLKEIEIVRRVLELRREQWLDRDELEAIRSKRLAEVFAAARRASHYRQLLDGHGEGCLEDLPILEKSSLRQSPRPFLASPDEPTLRPAKTSGSSGQSVEFFLSESEHLRRFAILFWTQAESGRMPTDLLASFSSGMPVRPDHLTSKLGLYRTLFLHMTADERQNLEALRRHKADIVSAYPTMMEILANIGRGNPLKLKAILSGGEVLTEDSRRRLGEAFSCEVFNRYACHEFAQIAWECPEEHSLHVHNSNIVEIVDGKGRPMESGEGEVVVTGLINRAMPLIRYRLGDIASWGRDCPCGRGLPVLKRLVGRSDDMIVLPSGRVRHPFSYNLGNYRLIVERTLVNQLVQEREDLFVFRYVPFGEGIDETVRSQVRELVHEASLGEEVSVEFEELERMPRGSTGKLKRITSKVRRPEDD